MPGRVPLLYPDPRLAQPAELVRAFDAALAAHARDLVDTLASAPALGLAGPHLGLMLRLVALDLAAPGEPRAPTVYVNPRVVEASAESARFDEGSVAMPGLRQSVERRARVRVAYQDLDGRPQEETAEGFRAAVLQHEIDQCDGVFWLERLSRLKRERALKAWAKTARR